MYEADEQRAHLDEMARNTRDYAVQDRDAGWNHEEEVWRRTRAEERYKEDREDRRAQVKANIELLKIYADRGYLDTANADIENIIRRIQGDAPSAPQVGGGDQFELPEGESGDPEDDNGD